MIRVIMKFKLFFFKLKWLEQVKRFEEGAHFFTSIYL